MLKNNNNETELLKMKNFFTFILLLGVSVFAMQCMENYHVDNNSEENHRTFVNTLKNPRAGKKLKSDNNPTVNDEVVKPLVCSYCEVRFLTQNSLTAHQTFSYCAKKLQKQKK